ncbi:MAG: type II toxin-antitoxin system HicA family toxin [Dehalococcoidia bacterium]|nr:type II toxin-antitoxin system HicA family toxin [Dehalococcoidia bacterium]
MSRFPSVTGSQLIKVLRKLGFEVIRTKGSHHFLRHPDGRSTVWINHSNAKGPKVIRWLVVILRPRLRISSLNEACT